MTYPSLTKTHCNPHALASDLDRFAGDRRLVEDIAAVVHQRDQDEDGEQDVVARDIEVALVEVGRRLRQSNDQCLRLFELRARVAAAASATRPRDPLQHGHVFTTADVRLLNEILKQVAL